MENQMSRLCEEKEKLTNSFLTELAAISEKTVQKIKEVAKEEIQDLKKMRKNFKSKIGGQLAELTERLKKQTQRNLQVTIDEAKLVIEQLSNHISNAMKSTAIPQSSITRNGKSNEEDSVQNSNLNFFNFNSSRMNRIQENKSESRNTVDLDEYSEKDHNELLTNSSNIPYPSKHFSKYGSQKL